MEATSPSLSAEFPGAGSGAASAPKPKPRLPLGPLKTIHAYWLAGMSCDGCSIAVTGATNPGIEGLLMGTVPAMPQLILQHPVLAVEAGEAFIESYRKAARGELGAPYVVIYEGSIADERIAARTGGYFSGMGVEEREGMGPQPVPTAEWLKRLAPGSAAVIAIGTCATWGGVPSAEGNPTGAMSVMDFLGKDFRSAFGLPVINIPGCAPVGDNFTETVFSILLFLQGLGPLPAFDELGRPAWLFTETVHQGCTRAGYYEEGTFAKNYGDPECLVEVGCWGPIVNCNIVKRGAINHMGGCMKAGGICIGCTMPGFPDSFVPFYKSAPGAVFSTSASQAVGTVIRRLRRLSNREANREHIWNSKSAIPSGWARPQPQTAMDKIVHFFYDAWRLMDGKKPGRPPGQEDRYWGADRPGLRSDHQDESATREDYKN